MHIEHVKMSEDGKLVIPAAFRNQIGLKAGDIVVIESDGDSLLLRTHARVLAEVQESFADTNQSELLLSEELIHDRRSEARRTARD